MSNWKKISDFIIFSTKGITPKYVENSSIIVLNQKCIRNGVIDYSFSQFTDDTKQISETKFVKKGDILINSTGVGTAGRCAFIEELPSNKRLITDSHILLLRCSNYLEARCLSYLLFSFEKTLMSFMTGSSGQGELDKVVVLNLLTKLPENSKTQQKIAKVLSDLDAKIELNNKINTELETMAKTLYDYWFVQFDFPNEEGKPYKSSGGKMVCNKVLKREIPEGWVVDTLSSWINNDKSGDWGKEQEEGNYNQKVYCVRGADINGLNGKGELKTPERYILEKNLFKTLDPHDLIVEISGGSPTQSTGRLAYITEETLHRFDAPIICSNFCKAVTLKNKFYFYNFVYQWNSIYDAGVLFGYEGKTSGIKNLLFESFVSSHNTSIPPIELAEKFFDFMTPIQIKKEKNLKENQELASLRDWLLPMLMNGQVTVEGIAKKCDDVDKVVLSGHIIHSNKGKDFGRVKLQKLLYLAEYYCQLEFDSHYIKNTAGPHDEQLLNLVEGKLKQYRFYDIQQERTGNRKVTYKPLTSANELEGMFEERFSNEAKKVNDLLNKLSKYSFEECEIIATLYAVWNNRIIQNEIITDELLKKDFLDWDKQKIKYKDRLDGALNWMRIEGVVPVGWGKVVE